MLVANTCSVSVIVAVYCYWYNIPFLSSFPLSLSPPCSPLPPTLISHRVVDLRKLASVAQTRRAARRQVVLGTSPARRAAC